MNFYGYGPGEAEQRFKMSAMASKRSVPEHVILNDVVALPNAKALYDLRGRRIDCSHFATLPPDVQGHLRTKLFSKTPDEVRLPDDLKVVEEPVLFGGMVLKHYGHFLIDSMSRLWARKLFPDLPILFLKPYYWEGHTPISQPVFEALELDTKSIIVDRPTKFRTVICPGTSFRYRSDVFSIADEPHVAVAAAIVGKTPQTSGRPVYLSRSGSAPTMRQTIGELELEAELQEHGFEVVWPETMSLAQQITLFEQSPVVLGTCGSAFHTALFSRAVGNRLAILTWGRGHENYLLVDQVKRHTPIYIKSLDRPKGLKGDCPVTVDVRLTLNLLSQAGLLERKYLGPPLVPS